MIEKVVMFIDTHAHIDFPDYDNFAEIYQNAKEAGVEKIVIPGVEPSTFKRIAEIVENNDDIYAALGVHPSEAKKWNDESEKQLSELLQHPKVIGVGEIGLDYYWDKTFIDVQQEVFIKQIELANKFNKTIIVHDREAHKDTFDILKKYANTNVIMHCFSGSVEFAKECVKKGYFLALGGVVTFKNAKVTKNVAKEIPLENLLLETDSPYLTPEPYRGKRNEPAYIKYVVWEIAQLRNISVENVAKITTQNAFKAFRFNFGENKNG